MAQHRRWWLATAAVGVIAVAGWVVLHDNPDKPARTRYKVSTEDYLPGVAADTFLPSATTQAPVVALVPGGAWRSADRGGLAALAQSLAEHGIVAVNVTYRAADAGVRFPVPVADVVCAVDYAVQRSRRAQITPGPVVVMGHSAGGHLAALAALRPAHFRGNCPYPPTDADALIGLAGAYDVAHLADVAQPLFGVPRDRNPGLWREGNPMNWANERPDVPALLAHGTHDDVLPDSVTAQFATALGKGGHRVRLELIDGADHQTVYTPKVSGDLIVSWVRALR